MKIRTHTIFPATAVGLVSAVALTTSVEKRALDYALRNTSNYTEVIDITKIDNPSLQQAKLDSMVFRNIFNQTQAAKDSAKVAQFEELSKNMKSTFNEIDRILVEEGISEEEYNMESFNLPKDRDDDEKYQYFADNWMYRNFFKKIGIMSDSIQHACDIVTKFIKP